MRLAFLGTGGGWPSRYAGVSALAVKLPGRTYLFDCGEGTQRQMMMSSMSFMDITHIFITHFHGDHFLGLPGLIQSMSLNDRKQPLSIVGPPGIRELVKDLLGLGYFTLSFPVNALELEDGGVVEDEEIRTTVFEVDHTVPGVGYVVEEPPRPGRFNKQAALGFGVPEGPLFARLQMGEDVLIDGKTIRSMDVLGPPRQGRKLVVTGDTRPMEPPTLWHECDAIVHDSTFEGDQDERALEYGHSTSVHAASAARACGAKRLFLVHRSPRYKDAETMILQARAVFGETFAPHDLEEYDVPLAD